MNAVWNLDPIYRGYEDPAFWADFDRFQETAAEFDRFTGSLQELQPLEGLRRGIAFEERILELGTKLVEYCSLRQAADTRDSESASEMGRCMAVFSATAGPEAAFKAWACSLPDLMDLVAGDPALSDYRFLFENMAKSDRYRLEGRGEQIMARMQLSGSGAWADLQQYLTSTVPVSFRDGVTNLSAIRNLAYDPDPATRKEAYEAELACYERIRDAVAFALNSIKLETISDCALRGYESPLDRTLKQSNMERATLDAMLGAMDEYLPKFWHYLKVKGRLLGHENSLPWYDLFAPVGSASTKFTAQQARDYLVELFGKFNPEEAEMIARAFDEAWIDFYPRDGKAGGAFCAGIPCLKQSRILTNFDGMFTDVVTLAHELGHAYHNYCIRDQRPLNQDYSMPLAETASTFNECVVMAAAIRDAGSREEEMALIESQLQDTTQIICDIYSRYRFETMVLENRESRFMDADTLCQFMLKAQQQSYGDGLDPKYLHPYMWICKGHYYGSTFYNFPYAFGGLFARGLYARYEREGEDFLPKYRRLLKTATVASAEDTARVAGIDLTDRNFWRSALDTVAAQIDRFCALAGEV